MSTTLKPQAVGLAALTLCAFSVHADTQRGLAAYEAGDYAGALSEWLPDAKAGELGAMYNVALLYDYGLGVAEDNEAAIRWYSSPAAAGNPVAQFNLATIYDYGDGVPEDDSKAAEWYLARCTSSRRASAVQSRCDVQQRRGGARWILERSMYWYKRAADLGYAPAQYNNRLRLRPGNRRARGHRCGFAMVFACCRNGRCRCDVRDCPDLR